MKHETFTELFTNPATIPLADIPIIDYTSFADFVNILMGIASSYIFDMFSLSKN